LNFENDKKKENKSLCLYCIYKIAQYTSNEVDCSLYGRVNYIQGCRSFIEKQKAS